MRNYSITEKEIDFQELVRQVIHPRSGAVATFLGTVRELTNGKRTLFLEYEAYVEMAEKKMRQIGDEIQEQFPESNVAIVHRIGRLDISDIAVAIAVSTPHRQEAFAACRYAIERIKEMVPIWKKEHWEDGSYWVGDQLETTCYPQGKPTLGGQEND